MGGELWCGELDADEMLERTVEAADAGGKLRGILEAVRGNRVEDDFSDCWTYARDLRFNDERRFWIGDAHRLHGVAMYAALDAVR